MSSDSLRPANLASVATSNTVCDSRKDKALSRVNALREMMSPTAQSNNTGNNTTLPRNMLRPFRDHPFRVQNNKKMQELAESIRLYGILQNLLVRPCEDGMYEILAGHRRDMGAGLAGLEDVPVKILNVDDDDAIIIMACTNTTNRDDLLPSEKAKAYRMQKEAFKRQGRRSDLYGDDQELEEGEQNGWDSSQMVADLNQENKRDIARYIRLTYLVPDLLDLVDSGDIAFRPAVDISYLTESEQNLLVELIASGVVKNISGPRAEELKKLSRSKQPINETVIKMIFEVNESPELGSYKIFQDVTKKALKSFKATDFKNIQIDPVEFEQIIIKAIKNYTEMIK